MCACWAAIGEFPENVRLATPKVVVVMTQDWCGQWANMKAYLPDFAEQAAIFAVEYNLLPDFERIMSFKEDVLDNQQVPYVRFYRAMASWCANPLGCRAHRLRPRSGMSEKGLSNSPGPIQESPCAFEPWAWPCL